LNLKDFYLSNNIPKISFEVFPPKDDFDGKKTELLFEELQCLKKYEPSLISVTYGAGGSNRVHSVDIVKRIKDELGVKPMPHFTCVSTPRANIKSYLHEIEAIGVNNILALRGDIPISGLVYNDFVHASDLVEFIKSESNLSVAVAGYPEGHFEAESFEKDIEFLKIKVDKGADVIFTQLFFNNECYFKFVDLCNKKGINVPIIPGIMPVTSYSSIQKIISLCKVDVPQKLSQVVDKYKDNTDYIRRFGVDYATEQCKELCENGVKGLHFYTLNKADVISKILTKLNIG